MRIPAFILALTWALSAQASSIVVIQGSRGDFDRRYFAGFSSLATAQVSAFYHEEKKDKALIAKMKKLAPDLILTIGEAPLPALVAAFPSTPIIASDLYAGATAQQANVVVMESEKTLKRTLDLAKELFPNKKNVGTIYNPQASQESFDLLAADAAKLNMKVASLKVDNPTDVQSFIGQFTGNVDLFYWIHDSTTSADLSLMEIFAFGEQYNIPILSSETAHLKRGAFFVVSADPFRMGEAAWKTAEVILKEGKIPQMSVGSEAEQYTVTISMKAIGKFGIGSDKIFAFLQNATKQGYIVQIVN